MNATPRARVILSADRQRFAEALRSVRKAGLLAETEYPETGSVTGTVEEDRLPALTAIDAVKAVERDRTYQLPPPGSPLQ